MVRITQVLRKHIVDDSIVIDLVKRQVELLEMDHKSWIIEGFPRTKL